MDATRLRTNYRITKKCLSDNFFSGNVSQKALQEFIDFVEKYQVDVAPERVFTIDEIQDAHRYLESAHSFGKVIVRVKEKEHD